MKRLFWAAAVYTVLGLASGLFYREYTKAHDFDDGFTQLAVMHTHLLTLGSLGFLLLLALEHTLKLTRQRRLFAAFFWIYNLGLLLTVAMMAVIGSRTVLGLTSGPALAGPAGMGHIMITIGFILLLVLTGRRVYQLTGTEPTAESERPRKPSPPAD